MKVILVLQARTNSSRLPAKVLLPLAGLPIVVLAARRAGNRGKDVLVVTSSSSDDDYLVEVLQAHKLPFFRGSLDNTLDRFVCALKNRADDTIVVRLTSDNVFPDGTLIDEIITDFHTRNLDYLSCSGFESGLPYGVSVEVTWLKHLRDAHRTTYSIYDQEHVTPSIIKKFGITYFEKYKSVHRGHYRSTIDTYDDYISLQRVFIGESDPINTPFLKLVHKLETISEQPLTDIPVTKLVLGTAQLGLDYGIANTTGRPSHPETERIIRAVITSGALYIDTARGYGTSESILGSIMPKYAGRACVITKLSPLADISVEDNEAGIRARVDASVYESCFRLRQSHLDILLLHRATHLSIWGGAVWQRLLELRDMGIIHTLGVSVQEPAELITALQFPEIGLIQLPFNILDWRWTEAIGHINEIRARRPVTIHARSALLQGLIQSENNIHWERAHVASPLSVQSWLRTYVNRLGRASIADLCFAYVRSQIWIDGVVVGMESYTQAVENIAHFSTTELSITELQDIDTNRPILSDNTLNPARWKKEMP